MVLFYFVVCLLVGWLPWCEFACYDVCSAMVWFLFDWFWCFVGLFCFTCTAVVRIIGSLLFLVVLLVVLVLNVCLLAVLTY